MKEDRGLSIALSMMVEGSGPAPPRPHPGLPLEALAIALQERREGALEAVIQRTQSACYRLALSLTKDPDLSLDALQEAYFVVYLRIGQLREPKAFKTWLFRIVSNCCKDILRARGREEETDFEQHPELQNLNPHSDPSDKVNRQLKIRATFEGLPEIDRTALALREVCAMSYEEMSRVLGVPLGTVRSRLAKARQRFIQLFQGGAE